MLVLLNLHDDVTLEHVGDLLSLALKDNLFVVHHALNDVHSESCWLLDDLLAFAFNAVLLVHFAFTATFIASLLHLHLHEAHVLVHGDSSSSTAFGACFCLSTLSAATFTLCAVDVPFNCEVFLHSIVKFFKSHSEIKLVLRALHTIVATTFVALNFVFTLLVIDLAFGFIR